MLTPSWWRHGDMLLMACKPQTLHCRLLAPTRWRHGDTLLMCLSTSQIGYSWIMAPDTLPPAYINFLNRHGNAPLHHLAAVRVCMYRLELHSAC